MQEHDPPVVINSLNSGDDSGASGEHGKRNNGNHAFQVHRSGASDSSNGSAVPARRSRNYTTSPRSGRTMEESWEGISPKFNRLASMRESTRVQPKTSMTWAELQKKVVQRRESKVHAEIEEEMGFNDFMNKKHQLESERSRKLLSRLASVVHRARDRVESMVDVPNFLSDDQEKLMENMAQKRVVFLVKATEILETRRELKKKMISGTVYGIFMLVFFIVTIMQRNIENSFRLEFALSSQLKAVKDKNLLRYSDANSHEQIFDWLETGLLPKLFPSPEWYNGEEFTEFEKDYFLNYNKVIGGLKIIQRRRNPKLCYHADPVVTEYFDSLYSQPSEEYCSKRFNEYYPIVYPSIEPTLMSKEGFGPSHDPSKYTWENDVNGGGFFVFTATESNLVHKILDELKADKWLDKASRKLEISFTVYNGNYRLFSVVTLVFGMLPTGLISKSFRLGTFKLENYVEPSDYARAVMEFMFVVYVFCSLYGEISELYYKRAGEAKARFHLIGYFSKFWNYIDILRIVMFFGCIGGWINIVFHFAARNLQLPLADGAIFYDFEPLLSLHRQQTRMAAGTIVVCLLSFFKYAHYSPKYGILVRTITRAARDLIQFLFMFAVIFVVFDVMGMVMFGSALEEWSSFTKGFQTLVMMLTVEYGMDPLLGVDTTSGVMFYFLFLLIAYFLLVNILLAILLDSYNALQMENSRLEEREQDNIGMGPGKEIFVETRTSVVRFMRKVFGQQEKRKRWFVSTDEMLAMVRTEALKDDAILVPGVATIMNPNPAPEFVVTFMMLSTHFPLLEARLLMGAVGEDWQEPETHHDPVEAVDPIEDLGMAVDSVSNQLESLQSENAELKAQLAAQDKKLDQLINLVTQNRN
mmetsp:Transcript_29719/g.57148  ORF Transcript_29719/g.57148 Transcript_29719/m.57148 type:complete len:868 (+) Transcript_29719:82-2685(+)